MPREPLKDRAAGRWLSILTAIGLPSKALKNKHGPCPISGCGGRDRFRYDDKGGRGTWICSHCGAGDGIELVKRFLGVDFKVAAQRIEPLIDSAPIRASSRPVPDERKRTELVEMWTRAMPVTPDDLAGRYLFERCGVTSFSPSLRFAPDERYGEPGQRPTWHPVLLAKIDPSDAAAAEGERAAIHRTYLSPYGEKAEVASPRKMLGEIPTAGAVRLMPHRDVLGIAEGIETAFSASVLFGVPVWSALTAGLLETWSPPENVSTVFIFGDNDDSGTGQAAAWTLVRRLKAKGLTVFVEIPTGAGQDWNDVHRERRRST